MTDRRKSTKALDWPRQSLFTAAADPAAEFFPQALFTKMLCLERNRAERSGRRLVLMLVDHQNLRIPGGQARAAEKIQQVLSGSTRETDIKGWYRDGAVIGVIFTEIPLTESSIIQILSRRVTQVLQSVLGAQANEVDLVFHLFPEKFDSDDPGSSGSDTLSTMYPDLAVEIESKQIPFLIKRCLDVAGSLFALILLAPVMILIAIAVKATSAGPVLFRQVRLGQSAKRFTFLKFRSMYANSDHAIHKAYIERFIANQPDHSGQGEDAGIFKLQADPRVTRVGRFLRRTSLDEIPQFFNVLAGDMSLVGPRPPLPYEFAKYEIWHRRRLLAVKPGITGFWQVEGRSRVKFDEMVRMDIAYARSWSIWMDIKILWKTPGAVVGGNGAC